MILEMDDWKFDIDMERTMEYSAKEAAEHCTCAYCRNFYAAVDDACPDLRSFMAQFGLELSAPDILYPYDNYAGRVCYQGEYVVFGSILQAGKEGINVAGAHNTYIWPTAKSEFTFPQPHFALSVEELEIPWVLNEPFEDVVSPANEPSFLKKMLDKLLARVKKSDFES